MSRLVLGRLLWPAPSADTQNEFQLCLSAVMTTTCPDDMVGIQMKPKTNNVNLCLDKNTSCFICSSLFCMTGVLEEVCVFYKNKTGAKARHQQRCTV